MLCFKLPTVSRVISESYKMQKSNRAKFGRRLDLKLEVGRTPYVCSYRIYFTFLGIQINCLFAAHEA